MRLTFLLACLAGAVAADDTPQPAPARMAGQHDVCVAGRAHRVTYDVNHVTDSSGQPSIYDVDTFSALKSVECNVDESSLKIIWHDEIHSSAFYLKVKTFGAYLVGSSCPMPVKEVKKGFLMRRAVSAHLDGQALTIQTVGARYDEIYSDASISYEPTGSDCTSALPKARGEVDQRVCVGVNTDDSCAMAASPIPIYSNGVISLTCSDCFIGLRADIFFKLKISGFQLTKLKAGFRQVGLLADVKLDMNAQKSWSAGVDKTLQIMPQQNLIDFKIGPVPFLVWFETPVQLTADAQLQATASASAGLKANYSIGDYYIEWTPDDGWTHVTPNPTVHFTPSASGAASFDGSAAFSLAPSFAMHANQMFTYTVALTPNLNLRVHGDAASKQICESTTYNVQLTSDAQLHLNIDWAHVHDDKEWGPKTIWQTQGNISQACFKV